MRKLPDEIKAIGQRYEELGIFGHRMNTIENILGGAIVLNRLKDITTIFNCGVDLKEYNVFNMAITGDNIEGVKELLKLDPEIINTGKDGLVCQVLNLHNLEMIKLLIDSGITIPKRLKDDVMDNVEMWDSIRALVV